MRVILGILCFIMGFAMLFSGSFISAIILGFIGMSLTGSALKSVEEAKIRQAQLEEIEKRKQEEQQ